jgi:hypothetical protein
MKSTAMETTEVAPACKTVEIRWVSELVVFPGMVAQEGSAIPTSAPVWPVMIAVAPAIGWPASAARKTE